MQLVMLLDGTLGFCNILTPVTCYGCDRPLCEMHAVPVDEQRDEEEREGVLCEGCRMLPCRDRNALRALRLQMNREGQCE